jgi:hypothetical protein
MRWQGQGDLTRRPVASDEDRRRATWMQPARPRHVVSQNKSSQPARIPLPIIPIAPLASFRHLSVRSSSDTAHSFLRSAWECCLRCSASFVWGKMQTQSVQDGIPTGTVGTSKARSSERMNNSHRQRPLDPRKTGPFARTGSTSEAFASRKVGFREVSRRRVGPCGPWRGAGCGSCGPEERS